ncbi:unnamed protein product, partial [Allacma fusca]
LEGVKELYEINQGLFSGYFDSVIFNEAAKSLERAVQDKHTNERLDKVINEFLVAVSPYMMIKAPLKCMEWLVCRFHIEKFNVDTVLKCTVFYHSMIPRLLHWSLRFLKDRNSRRTPNGFGWYRQFKRDCPCRKLYSFCESECKVHHMTIRCADQVSCAFLTSTLLENENLHSSLYMILTMLVIIRKETPETSPKIPATSTMNVVIRTYPPTLEKHAILLLNLVGSAGYFELLSFKKEPELRDKIIQAIAVLMKWMCTLLTNLF